MLLLSWLACSNPAPSPPLGNGSAYTVYDSGYDTAPGEAGTPGVQVQFLDEEGHPVGDDPVPWTMVYGPAGGWFLRVWARVTGIQSEELPVQVEASALLSETEGFWSRGYRVMLTPEEDGAAYLGAWPQTEVRMFPIDDNPYDLTQFCGRAGQEAPLRLVLERIDEEEPVELVTVEHTVRFLMDPYIVPYCEEGA